MSNRVFFRSIGRGPSQLSFDTDSRMIYFSTRMYDPKGNGYVMREVSIDHEEWMAIVKYGEEAGYSS